MADSNANVTWFGWKSVVRDFRGRWLRICTWTAKFKITGRIWRSKMQKVTPFLLIKNMQTRVKKRVSERVLRRAMHIIRSETLRRRLASGKSLAKCLAKSLGESLGKTFRARQASPQSLGSDYMHSSPQDSLRDSFFHAGHRFEPERT